MNPIYPKETLADLTTISAMELRREPGRFLDRADFGNETIVVERAGRPKAALVPLRDLEEMRRLKREARQRFFSRTEALRERFAPLNAEAIERLVTQAVADVRALPGKAA